VIGKFSQLDFDPALRSRRTASDYIAEALRDAILDGQFEDGEELNQVELANHFNVSRVPVREAIRQLQAEGLVSAEPHRRVSVIGFSRERIDEAFEVRAVLEDYLLKKAAPRLDEARLERLYSICEELDVTEDRRKWLDKNREFHRVLHEPSGAKMALALVEQMTLRVERYLQRAGGVDRAAEVGREHRTLLKALENNDIPAARSALELHISRTREAVMKQLRQSGAEDDRKARS
jgi:DNA-binding GntR family transcriptional regulator